MQLLAILCAGLAFAAPDAPEAPAPRDEAPAEDTAEAPAEGAVPGEAAEADDEAADTAAPDEAPPPPVTGTAVTLPPPLPVPAEAPPPPPVAAQFLAGNVVEVGDIGGDVVVTGNTVRIEGEVADNAVLMGRMVTVRAPIGGDLVAMGQIVRIDAPVAGDLYALGAEVEITEDGSVGGTVLGTGQRIVVEGAVAGNVSLRSEQLELDGPITGDASLTFSALELGNDAAIGGDLRYVAPNTHEDLAGVAKGEAAYSLAAEVEVRPAGVSILQGILRVIGSFLAQLLVGVVMLKLLGDFARKPARTIAEQPLISLVLGTAVLVAIPVLTIVLGFVFTILWRDVDLLSGMVAAATPPLGAAAVTVWGFGFIVGRILTALTIGELLLQRLAPERRDNPMAALAAGLVPLVLLSAVPFLDFAVWGIATALGLGGTWLYLRVVTAPEGTTPTPL